jgi:leucyl aminopeptidase
MDLVNAPSNYKRPAELGEWALASAAEYGYRATVWGQDQIKAAGMQALLAVNQGSAHPAAFIITEYQPQTPGNYPTVALVGKGVTFDTGGLSIKASANMHYMKSDMGGAAAVLGTLEVAAQLQMPIRLLGFIPATENSVDAHAVKPGDVIGSYAGKTIEVIDTDAEGRLILADALSYAVKQYQPNVLIDLATLTGSAVRTLGYVAGALFTHNDNLAHDLYQAGWNCGERLWRLPLWDLYKDDVKSDIADLRNFSGKPTAGAISAAKFLEAFVDDHPAWAHLDIAGVAYTDSEVNGGKTASAYGIRLLLTYLQGLTQAS